MICSLGCINSDLLQREFVKSVAKHGQLMTIIFISSSLKRLYESFGPFIAYKLPGLNCGGHTNLYAKMVLAKFGVWLSKSQNRPPPPN